MGAHIDGAAPNPWLLKFFSHAVTWHLIGQAKTTLFPAPGQNLATIFCSHSFPKPMLFLPLPFLWLICSFRHIPK